MIHERIVVVGSTRKHNRIGARLASGIESGGAPLDKLALEALLGIICMRIASRAISSSMPNVSRRYAHNWRSRSVVENQWNSGVSNGTFHVRTGSSLLLTTMG
mgnify:CR=1 FL=1